MNVTLNGEHGSVIVSASRRTDLPAFYAEWFMNRVAEGYCLVPNPFNRAQVSRISLATEEVDAVVFWTRHPRPLMPRLGELDARGFRYYFQFTLLGYPREIDPRSPPLDAAVAAFQELGRRIGPERVVWRYDPIYFSGLTPAAYHVENYARIAERLAGCTRRSVVSIVDRYRKLEPRLRALAGTAAEMRAPADETRDRVLREMVKIAAGHGMEVVSCAEEIDMRGCGIRPGKCVDDGLLAALGIRVPGAKDPSQRKACGCVVSRDVGMYDTCRFGCAYCYATTSFERARENHARHDPWAESLL